MRQALRQCGFGYFGGFAILLLQGSSANQNWLDGLSLWVKLIALGAAAASSWFGYKVNQVLFKPGGVMERLNELSEEVAKIQERKEEHSRRIRDLENWRFNRNDRRD